MPPRHYKAYICRIEKDLCLVHPGYPSAIEAIRPVLFEAVNGIVI